jgi:hypothetical protein
MIQAVLEDPALSSDDKCVFIYLLVKFLNNDTGRCDPGQDLLAAKLNLSLRTTQRAMAKLKARGALISKRRKQTSAAYEFPYPYRQEPPQLAGLNGHQEPSLLAGLEVKNRQNEASRTAKSRRQEPPPLAEKPREENLGKRTIKILVRFRAPPVRVTSRRTGGFGPRSTGPLDTPWLMAKCPAPNPVSGGPA